MSRSSTKERRVLAKRYRVEKKLGSGNFGVAFLVTDLKAENDELKVLKEISVGEMQPDETIESVHEANLLAKLNHPHIVSFHDSFLDGEYFCIVTEYCEGGDLDARFKKLKKENTRLREEQILDWFVQLLSAVNYMHSRRVLHRDLKARNIFLKNESIKIGDFGISRILMGTMDMASTFTGTPYYMSPEVLKHEGYNSKSDIWSVGCLLYEMCTFQHAFEGQGLMGVMYKIVEGKVPDLPHAYSRELNQILQKIFVKDPSNRPSALECIKDTFIQEHVKSMIERLSNASSLNDPQEETIQVKQSTDEISRVISTKYYVRDLRRDNDNYDVEDKLEKTLDAEMTPKERMIQNKLKKADEEAKKLGRVAKENYEERMIRDSFRREATFSSTISRQNSAVQGLNRVQNNQTYLAYEPKNEQSKYLWHKSESEDEYEGTLLKTVQSNDTRSQTIKQINPYDEKPVQPLRHISVSESFTEDGIPIDPDVTNEYYKNFDFDAEDDEPYAVDSNFRNSMSRTVLHSKKLHIQKKTSRIRKSKTISSNGSKHEYEQLIDVMHEALDLNNKKATETFGDDSINSVFGIQARNKKIQNLRAQAIRILGESTFKKCYDYLKHQRKSKSNDEMSIFEGLKLFNANPSDCFLVDQLIFLEEL